MARTPSTMIPLGTEAPDFTLPDTVSGKLFGLQDFKSEVATVVMFICNHCPFVKHVESQLVRIANDFSPKGVKFVAISSNDVTQYPDDAPDKMKEYAQRIGMPFPYLYDATQDVAKSFDASCTPDIFVYDKSNHCVYRGQLDDSRPGNDVPLTGADLRSALQAIISGQPVSTDQKPNVGCNIKWK